MIGIVVVVEKNVVVGKIDVGQIVVTNIEVDIVAENDKVVGFHKWILSNFVDKVNYDYIEETMVSMAWEYYRMFVHNFD